MGWVVVGLGCPKLGWVVRSWVGLSREAMAELVCQPCGSPAEFEERFLRLAADCPAPDIVALQRDARSRHSSRLARRW